jgi:hypothetical protein
MDLAVTAAKQLGETVGAGAEKFEEAEVAEDLELLADFGLDVAVGGMELGEFVGVRVNVGQGEFEFAQGLHDLQDVEGPASFFDF